MPKSYPDFPHHSQIAAVLRRLRRPLRLPRPIRFETTVERAARGADGVWTLDARRRRGRALRRAARRQRPPLGPALARAGVPRPDTFDGHADPRPRLPRRASSSTASASSSSGWATARWTSRSSRPTSPSARYLAARRGAWILPKYLVRPADRPASQRPADPVRSAERVFETMIRLHVGTPEKLRPAQARPPLRRGAPDGLRADPRPHRSTARSRRSRTSRASTATRSSSPTARRERVDVVVYCTGYRITFPFFDEDFISAPDNRIELFRRVFHPDIDDVFFVGLLQPLGAIMPIAEAQGAVDRRLPQRRVPLPPRRRDAARTSADDQAAMRKRYVASKRHTIQVDFDEYLRDLERERAAGAERARARGLRAAGRRARARAERPRHDAAADGGRQARAHEGRPTARRSSRAAREVFVGHRLRRGERPRHRPPHRPRERDLLQLLPRQGVGPPRARRRDRRRARGPASAPRARAATTLEALRRRRLPRLLRVPRPGPRDVSS